MELHLHVDLEEDGTFEVCRNFVEEVEVFQIVVISDYRYTPWPRYNGNLLWP